MSYNTSSSERNNNSISFDLLREENHRLKEEVHRLGEELKLKDSLLSLLESQIGALVVQRRADNISDDDENDDDDGDDNHSQNPVYYSNSDTINTGSKTLADVAEEEYEEEPSQHADIVPDDDETTDNSRSIRSSSQSSRGSAAAKFNSYTPRHSFPSLCRSPSLRPPSRSKIEMKHPPAPTHEHKYGFTRPCSRGPISPRKGLQTGTAAIKALPRELSIAVRHSNYLSDDDDDYDEHNYPEFHQQSELYEVVRTECIDAYNSRGLYTGTLQRATQMPHGKGRMEYHKGGSAGGRFYNGDWHVGHWHGKGIIRDLDGDVYEGQVVNDLKDGVGTIRFIDGRIFHGNFVEDEMVRGTMTYIDGARFTGEFHHGNRHGQGFYYFPDGSVYKGGFVMDIFEGWGKMTWEDGGWYEGDWSRGDIHGFGIEYRPDGSVRHDGRWIKGVPLRTSSCKNRRPST